MLDQTDLETAAPASPPTPSPSPPSLLRGLMDRFRQAEPESDPEPAPEASAEPTGGASPAPAPAPASDWKAPASREEYEQILQREAQSEVDRRERVRSQRERDAAEQQRQRELLTLEQRYDEARRTYGGDSLEAAALAEQYHDLRQGIQKDYYDEASQRELLRVARIHAAAETHKAAFSPLLEGLPDPELKKLSAWWMQNAVPDAQGRTKVEPDQALLEMAKQITKTRDAQVQHDTINGIFDLVDQDPVLKAQFVAHIHGSADFDEPEHLVGGTAAGLPSDAQLRDMLPDAYNRLHLSEAAENALLKRPVR